MRYQNGLHLLIVVTSFGVIGLGADPAFAARGGARVGAPPASDATATATATPSPERPLEDGEEDYEQNLSAGLGVGMAFPTGSDKKIRLNLGFNLGIDLTEKTQFALYFYSSSQALNAGNNLAQTSQSGASISLVGAQYSYIFDGKLSGLMAGPMLGLAVVSVDNNGTTGATIPLSAGLHLGYDHFISE
ncbi:MAG: hypothetical protein AB7P04_08990, partial [Bacteriovoracia bacterium]